MGLFTRLVEIEDVKLETYYNSWGTVKLYPEGTKRYVKKLTIFGWKEILQEAIIENDVNSDSVIYYNKWKKVKK
jgi:hypothetical protein